MGLKIRQFHLLSAYSAVGDVVLIFFYEDRAELEFVKDLEPYVVEFRPVRKDWPRKYEQSSYWWCRKEFEGFGLLRPSMAKLWFSRQMKKEIENASRSASLIHVSRLYMATHVEALMKRKCQDLAFILDLDDNEVVFKRRMLQHNLPGRLRTRMTEYFDLMALRWYQSKAIRWFDRTYVCSDHDKKYLGDNNRIEVVANGASVQETILPDESDGKTILCLGTYGYWPNVDALFFFLHNILPLIRENIPGSRLLVVGRDMHPEVKGLHNGKDIIVEGDVPSVYEYYRKVTISVVPLRVGAGTRLKILEAFALGRPVVSTTVGCEGLEVVDNRELLIANNPEDFSQACIKLVNSPRLRDHLVLNGRKLVREKYDWSITKGQVKNIAGDLLGARGN